MKAQRLSMEWFGFDIEPLRKIEIGARSKRGRKNVHEQFISEIGQVFDQTARVLKPDGYGLIVFGTSPSRADTLQPFLQRIEKSGFVVVVQNKRTISNNRRQMPSLTEETVLVVTRK